MNTASSACLIWNSRLDLVFTNFSQCNYIFKISVLTSTNLVAILNTSVAHAAVIKIRNYYKFCYTHYSWSKNKSEKLYLAIQMCQGQTFIDLGVI